MNVGGAHLTYCTNVHRGESWPDVARAIAQHVVAVKARVSPGAPFGVGLRLSASAARELAEPRTLATARAMFALHGLYVFTINGFPYGAFHGTPVKEAVYRPDWLGAPLLHQSPRRGCEQRIEAARLGSTRERVVEPSTPLDRYPA